MALAAAAVAGTCLGLAACGSIAAPGSGGANSSSASSAPASSAPASSTTAGASSASTAAAAQVSLDVTFAASAGRPATHYTLFCEPAGGTTPDPAAACAKLLTGLNIFALLPRHIMCPMVLQTDARAVVTGTYLGKPVHVTIFDGGCDISRWTKLKLIFG